MKEKIEIPSPQIESAPPLRITWADTGTPSTELGQQQTEEKKSEGQENEITVSRQPWKRINIRSIPHKGPPLATSQRGPVGFSKWDAIIPAHRQPFQNLQLFKNSSHILSLPLLCPSLLSSFLPSPNSPISKGEAWQDYCDLCGLVVVPMDEVCKCGCAHTCRLQRRTPSVLFCCFS